MPVGDRLRFIDHPRRAPPLHNRDSQTHNNDQQSLDAVVSDHPVVVRLSVGAEQDSPPAAMRGSGSRKTTPRTKNKTRFAWVGRFAVETANHR
jgi:hypothetical protein